MSTPRPVRVTASTTAVWGQLVLVDATAGNIVITLPRPSVGLGPIGVKKTDGTANTVTVTRSLTALIDGATTYVLADQFDAVELVPDGNNWQVTSAVGAAAAVEPTAPPAPTIGTATAGDAQATVTHTLNGTGGSPITATRIIPHIAGVAQTAQVFADALLTHVAVGLTNGTAYTFKVEVVNVEGTSAASAASNSVTPTAPPGGDTQFITGLTVAGPTANNHSGSLGYKFVVGASPVTVNSVGRWVVAGNSQTHVVRIVRVSDLVEVASAVVATSGVTAETIATTPLGAPVVLAASTAYYILSAETSGGDAWHDPTNEAAQTAVATIDRAVYQLGTGAIVETGLLGPNCYVPPSFGY